jgi:hypothetical protein
VVFTIIVVVSYGPHVSGIPALPRGFCPIPAPSGPEEAEVVESFFTMRSPSDLAKRSAQALANQALANRSRTDAFRRDTFALPRDAAREKARDLFKRFPKAAYMTEIEAWRELPDGRIEFTMRRLPTAD